MKNSKVVKVKISLSVYEEAVKTIYGIGNEDTDLSYHSDYMDILPEGADVEDITYKGPKNQPDFILAKDNKPFLIKPSRWDIKYAYDRAIEDIIDVEVDLEAVAKEFEIACRDVKDSHIISYIEDNDAIYKEVKRLTGKSKKQLEDSGMIDEMKVSLVSSEKAPKDPTIRVIRNSKTKKTNKKSK